jgi:hypothetical protein
MALLGASHAMGSGVRREDTFEAVLEARLNQDKPGACYEILNFAVYGYNPLHQIGVLDKVATFQPQTVLYVAHPEDADRVVKFIAEAVAARKTLPFEDLATMVKDTGVTAEMPERVIVQRLMPLGDRFLSWLYRRLVGDSRRLGASAGYIFLPMIPESPALAADARQIELARASGFVVLDLSNVYVGSDRSSLWVAEWDAHPNARAHRLIADTLYPLIQQNRDRLLGTAGDVRATQAR